MFKMETTIDTNGATFIITGGSRGIGLATAQHLLAQPAAYNLVVVARGEGRLAALRAEYADRVQTVAGNLADASVGCHAVGVAVGSFGRIDGLVLNHAVMTPVRRICDTSWQDWQRSFEVNVFGCISLITAALPWLRQTSGRIVFTTSGSARQTRQAWGVYGASKAALNHLASSLALEEPGVTTLSIIPGMVDTDMSTELRDDGHMAAMGDADVAYLLELHRKGDLLHPSQPGNAIGRAVLRAPARLTGRVLNWDETEQLID